MTPFETLIEQMRVLLEKDESGWHYSRVDTDHFVFEVVVRRRAKGERTPIQTVPLAQQAAAALAAMRKQK